MTPAAAQTRGFPVLDVARVRADFPILRRQARPAARLPRQRGHHPEAAGGHRRPHALLHRGQRQRAPRRPRAQRARDARRTRARGARSARSSTPRTNAEIVFTRDTTESINLVAQPSGGRTSAPATRCSSRRWSTTRTSCRGSCCARRRGARLRVAPIDDRGELMLDEFEALLSERTQARVRDAHVERPRHDQPRGGDRPHRAPARRAGAPRWLPGGVSHAGRRPGARLRLLRRHRAQAVRPDRDRRPLRQGGAARARCRRTRAAAT